MTTIDLYRKHKTGDISREKFLYEVRRDEQLPWITNLTSYDDAVKILKNKGVVTEAKVEEPAKPKAKKSSKTLTIDYVNPYQFRHGLVYELEQLGDISDESLAKAKEKVLKNLTKDPTFYSTLLNQKQSPYEFKAPETDAPGMQANADGTLKKGAGKLEKANVKDNLGKKEAGKAKPKGVKVMPDKGVEGTQKTIKEGSDLTLTKKVKESKHAKLKELLKTKLKETLSVADIQAAKKTGKPINVSKTNTQDIKALQTAKANFSTYE
jgi:hypothetical protein